MGTFEVPAVNLHFLHIPARSAQATNPEHLVLIHGLAANMGFWNAGILLPLSRAFNIVAYDLRGHGRSGMPRRGYSLEQQVGDLEALLDHLDLDHVHLLAHSFGGAIAVLFALRQRRRTKSLILTDTRLRALQPEQRLADWEHWPKWGKTLKQWGVHLDAQDTEGGYQLLIALARLQVEAPSVARQLSRLFTSAGRRRGSGDGPARRWLRLHEQTCLFQEFCFPDSICEDRLRGLEIPILGVYGEHSNTMPTALALAQICPNFTLRVIRGAGHFFPITHPRRLLKPVVQFFRTRLAYQGKFARTEPSFRDVE